MQIKPIDEVINYLTGKKTQGRPVSLHNFLNSIGGIPSLDKYIAHVIAAPIIHDGPGYEAEFVAVPATQIVDTKVHYSHYSEYGVKVAENVKLCHARHALNIISELHELAEYVYGHVIGIAMEPIHFPIGTLGVCFYITADKVPGSIDEYAVRLHGVLAHQVINPDIILFVKK